MKNLIKGVKKLKLWSKKKRKKKDEQEKYEHTPPPPLTCHHHCCCSCSTTTHPSAPPLPPFSWLEAEQHNNNYNYGTFLPPQMAYSSQTQDLVSVSEPVYGIPVQTTITERSTGQFGCVVSFYHYLFRCLCPCFHIRH